MSTASFVSSLLRLVFRETTSNVSGDTIRSVCCARCQCNYVYRLQANVTEKVTRPFVSDAAAAEQKAKAALARTLESDCAAVPCPKCACYQPNMVSKLRRQRLRWLLSMTPILILFVVSDAAVGYLLPRLEFEPNAPPSRVPTIMYGLACVALAMALALPVLRLIFCSLYDPNSTDKGAREALGQQLACTQEEFNQGKMPLESALA